MQKEKRDFSKTFIQNLFIFRCHINNFVFQYNIFKSIIPYSPNTISNYSPKLNINFLDCLEIYNQYGRHTKLFNVRINVVTLSYYNFILTETQLTRDISIAKLGFERYMVLGMIEMRVSVTVACWWCIDCGQESYFV